MLNERELDIAPSDKAYYRGCFKKILRGEPRLNVFMPAGNHSNEYHYHAKCGLERLKGELKWKIRELKQVEEFIKKKRR
jgi:hypothetical protein